MDAAPSLSLWGRFHRSSRWLPRRLGAAGYLFMTVPLTVVFVLRVLGVYEGAVRELMGFVGPLMMFVLGPALLFFGWRSGRPRWFHGALRLDGDQLELATDRGTEHFDLRRISAGIRHDTARGGFELHLDHEQVIGGEMLTAAPGASVDAAGLLRALGVDASRRAVTLRTSPVDSPAFRAAWFFVGIMPALMSLDTVKVRLALMVLGAALAWVLAAAWRGPAVTIGLDGLRVVTLVGARFIPWAAVTGVAVEGRALRATLASGEAVHLGVAGGGASSRAEAMRSRIEEARSQAATADPRHEAATARQGRTEAQWREAMAALVGSASYRDEPVSEDDLEAVLRAGTASAEQREGAALALMAVDPARNATRVRIAASSLADEPTREALEAIARGGGADEVPQRASRRR